MLQSPEVELLLLCARPQLDSAAVHRLQFLLQQELDWAFIFEYTEYYRTIPLLAMHLNQHAVNQLANETQAELQRHHRNSTQHNLVLAMEILRLKNIFSIEGIEFVPFKGPVSAIVAYSDMAMRACGDIDLLVKQSNYNQAERLLETEGFIVKRRFRSAMQSSLWHEQRKISIDLHWGIPPLRLRLNSGLLWKDLNPINMLGQPILTFSPRDTLLVTAINAVKEYWTPSVHHMSDIVALTSNYTDEDWLAAFDRSRTVGCRRILVAAVLLTHRLLDMSLPTVGPTRLFRHRGINKVVDELQDYLFMQSDKPTIKPVYYRSMQQYYLTLTDSPWQRSYDWLKWAGKPNAEDQDFVKLRRTLSFLYFFIRPIRLLLKRL